MTNNQKAVVLRLIVRWTEKGKGDTLVGEKKEYKQLVPAQTFARSIHALSHPGHDYAVTLHSYDTQNPTVETPVAF